MREWSHSSYEYLKYALEVLKMSNIYDFDSILKTERNLQHITRNCIIKNLDDFEKDETDDWRAALLNVKEKGITLWTLCYIMSRCLVMFLRGESSKCSAVLMKHPWKVKGEQVVTLQMAHQLKTKNINVAPEQQFFRQCKAKVLLETDSLYRCSR